MPFAAAGMGLEMILLSDLSQSMINISFHSYVKSNFKKTEMKLLQNKNRLKDLRNKLMVPKGEMLWWGDNLVACG